MSRATALPLLLLAAVLAACGDDSALAVVGETRISTQDLDQFVSGRAGADRRDLSGALDTLVARTLLAEGARQNGLLDDPAVRARVAAAQREVLAQALLDKELASSASDAQLRARYEEEREQLERRQVHVRQILVRPTPGETAAATEARARMVYAKLISGESFEELAKQSDDPVGAARGGELPPVKEGEVDPTFFAAAAALHKGELGKPFSTGFGFHVLQALEEPSTSTPPFEEVRGKLAVKARAEAEVQLVTELRKEIEVKLHPERLAGGTP